MVGTTRKVLAELRDAGLKGKATFFIAPGRVSERNEQEGCVILKEVLADGHEVEKYFRT
jgi:peptidoglycan/xylan/chitin deacetylase (PgdA/CDA1 family)